MKFACYKPKKEIQLKTIDGDTITFFENEIYPSRPFCINGSAMRIIVNPADITRKGCVISAKFGRKHFVPAHITVTDDDHRIETICNETKLEFGGKPV